MFTRYRWLWLTLGALFLLLLAFNFLNFRLARSNTEVNSSFSTIRAGDTLPESMTPGFTQLYLINGDEQFAEKLGAALEEQFEGTIVGTTTAVQAGRSVNAPFLIVELAPSRLWTPLYGRANVEAQIYYAHDGDAPWPLDEPLIVESSPAIKGSGEFALVDRTWGLLSKPGYYEHLAQALAEKIVAALQNDIFTLPPP
jgi:hypothetical protein